MAHADTNNLIDVIKLYFPNDAIEISDALELLNLALDGLLGSTNMQIAELHKNKEYDKGVELWKLSKSVSKIQEKINECSASLNIKAEIEEEENGEEFGRAEEQKTIPNYAEYVVDSSIPHTLYEDFTHKKAAAFSMNNKRYEATDWKDVLLQTCDLLADIDASEFLGFVDDPVMKGRTISYFGKKHIDRKNLKMKNLDIYVWTNLSANSIRNLIRKLLKKFNMKITDYYIYLRADYTPLHMDYKDEYKSEYYDGIAPNIPIGVDEKRVGKHVRQVLRELSNSEHRFSNKELSYMLTKKWSKEAFNIDYPFLKEYRDGVDISIQIKDGDYGRYWKEVFVFNGKKYLVTSQWYERNREPFDKWIEALHYV